MKISKEKLFNNIIANSLIVFMLIMVCAFGFRDEVSSVFSGDKLKAFYNGNLNKAEVSLMINVYWGTEYLDNMLNTLKDNDVKVTFFVGGMWASENEEMLQRFIDEGHELGNHGYYHKDHDKISVERNREEITITHKLVEKLTGVEMTLFAPPSGAYNTTTLSVADSLGYKTIMWTKDTIDWRDKDTSLIYKRAVAKPNNGDFILMHPTKNTAEALESIIKFYKTNNYRLVTVSQNLS